MIEEHREPGQRVDQSGRVGELQERAHQQTVVAELGQRALATTDVPVLFRDVARVVQETLHVEFCEILERVTERTLLLRAGAGWREGMVGQATVYAGRESQAGYTLLSGEPVILDDLPTESRFRGPPLLSEHGVVSGMTVIIHGASQPYGVLGAHTSNRRIFTHDDIDFLRSVANVLGLALERSRTEQELASSRDQLQVILQGVDDGITVQDPAGRLVYANAAAAHIIGFPSVETLLAASPEELTARFDLIDEDGQLIPLSELPGRRALQGEQPPETVLGFRVRSTGEERWSTVKATPIINELRNVQMVINVFVDVTNRVRGERERAALLAQERQARRRAEEAQDRLAFLAEAGNVLAGSLDYEATLATVARLAVARMADWCVVHIVEADGTVRQLLTMHPDPARMQLAQELEQRYPYDPSATTGVPQVLRTGEPEIIREITDELLTDVIEDQELLQIVREVGLKSSMVLPMIARGRVVGAITFVAAESGRRYGTEDLQLAQQLANRAAIAVDNARLYAESRRAVAEQAAVLDHIADGVMFADPAGNLVFMNDAARSLIGIDTAPSLADVMQLLDTKNADGQPISQEETVLGRALQGETLLNVERQLRRADGSEMTVRSSAAPVTIDEGRLLGAVIVFRDVSEERELERQKDAFLSAAAHDLKTPLASVKGHAQLLRRRIDRGTIQQIGQVSEGLDKIDSTVSRLARLVNELLDVSRLQMGQPLDLNLKSLDLVQLVHQTVSELSINDERHRILVRSGVPHLHGRYDADRLERVLNNLLSNAIKYSPNGGDVVVTVKGERDGDGAWAAISVQDQGIGIPAADLPRIFERFYRARNVDDRIPGTGVGLAGVQQIIEQHQGTISVDTREGVGSTFTMRLPLSPF